METAKSNREQRHILVDCFLVCYNGLQILGWCCLFTHMLLFSNEAPNILWHNLQNTLIACTSFLLLELFYSLWGIVRTNTSTVFFLILCRLIIVWGVLMSSLPALHNTGLNLLILGWSTHEIIRYLFYCLDVMDCLPYLMIWLR
uniref:Very-long-chain (3R)-3-hydroxyacyl-CoA dehydratase n=1 Tax=Cacopsylla melanoneura TaxID=428564 RepID=A0A8D8TSW5_9HEMI